MLVRSHLLAAALLQTLVAADNPRLDFAFGVLARERENPEEAAAKFERTRQADPTAAPLVKIAVRAKMQAGDRAGAVKLYRDLATARPENLPIQLQFADFLRAEGRGDGLAAKLAEDTLNAALQRDPGEPEIISRMFLVAGQRSDKSLQQKLLDALDPRDPAAAMMYGSLAKGFYGSDNEQGLKALDEHYRQAIEAHPEVPPLARAASDYFHDTGRPDAAIDVLVKHVQAEPSSLDLRVRLGILYFEAKRDLDGENALKEVLAIAPKTALAHQALAKFYRLREQPVPAREHSAELLKIRGGSVDEFLKLGNELLDANEPRQARLLLERANFQYPEHPELAIRLAIATRRDPTTRAQAARLFREAETLADAAPQFKTDPAFLAESAEALIDEGQIKPAEERLRSAIKRYPATAKKEAAAALRRLAGLFESEGRAADAGPLRDRADALDR